jgi:ADP-glucose pyrophosphorylase
MRNVIALILGGGRGTRLFPLTSIRSKPAVPLAGKYRLIDIPISNCINSEINRIYVLTQFMSVSLHNHLRQTYLFDHFSGGFSRFSPRKRRSARDATGSKGRPMRLARTWITSNKWASIMFCSCPAISSIEWNTGNSSRPIASPAEM